MKIKCDVVYVLMLSLLINSYSLVAQEKDQVMSDLDSVMLKLIENKLVQPEPKKLLSTTWKLFDGMGVKTLEFPTPKKYKLENKGVGGEYAKSSGSWYIYDRYVVLEYKKEKFPLYHVKIKGKFLLIDQKNIKIATQLIKGFVAKDQLISELDEETFFGFLNGYEQR